MKLFKYALTTLSLSSLAFAMQEPSVTTAAKAPEFKGGSIQNLLDSKPNYQLLVLGECCLEPSRSADKKFTSVAGIENIDSIAQVRRINLDGNAINLDGKPLNGMNLACSVFTLNSNGISRLLPQFFTGLHCLTRLELEDNAIDELPKNWGPLVNLVELRLSKNRLTKIPSGSFKELQSLSLLTLDRNQISEFALESDELPNLLIIALEYNQISELDAQTCKNLARRYLDCSLSHNSVPTFELYEKILAQLR